MGSLKKPNDEFDEPRWLARAVIKRSGHHCVISQKAQCSSTFAITLAMRRGGTLFKQQRAVRRASGDEGVLELCGRVTERNVGSILLPELRKSRETLHQVLKVFKEQKQGRLAFATLEAVRQDGHMKLTASNYIIGISACCRSKLSEQALKLFEAMPKAKVDPNVISYSAAISACEKGGQWQQALKLFEAMPKAKVDPNVISYSAAISACEKGGQWQQALKLFEAMPKAKVEPDVVSYSAAISACEKGGQWQQALKLFEDMSEAKVHPNVISYSAAISACEKGGQWQQALKLFEDMPKAKVHPNIISYSAAISACEKGGQWQQAFKLFEAMPEAKVVPDAYSFSGTISACEKGGQWQQALKLFEDMRKAKVHPNVISYSAAISACEKGGQWQQALKLFEAMPKAKVEPDGISYNALFDSLEICNGPIGRHLFQHCSLPTFSNLRKSGSFKIDLHDLSEGSARLALRHWLSTSVLRELERNKSLSCIVVAGQGHSRKEWDKTDVREAALNLLRSLKLKASLLPENPGRIRLDLTEKDLPTLRNAFGDGKQLGRMNECQEALLKPVL